MTARISVALCTYNGEKFLEEQLESIRTQERPPDELVACDDASVDGTVRILEAFQKKAPFEMKVERNPANLGYVRNFEKALSLCRGEAALFCDQDDVWEQNKVSELGKALEREPAADLVFSDASLIDDQGRALAPTLWECVRFDPRARALFDRNQAWKILFDRNVVTGAAAAVRLSAIRSLIPTPEGWPHDYWLALGLALQGRVRYLSRPLLRYRVHGGNAIGVPLVPIPEPSLGDRLAQTARGRARIHEALLRKYETILSRLGGAVPREHPAMTRLRESAAHRRARLALPSGWFSRFGVVSRELFSGRYHRNGGGFLSAAADLFRSGASR